MTNARQTIDERKRALRHSIMKNRQYTTTMERIDAGELCADAFFALPLFLRARTQPPTIACHVSMGTEISTLPILSEAVRRGCRLLVPRLGAGRDIGWSSLTSVEEVDALHHEYTARSGHAMRPDEPDAETLPAQALADADAIVLPALAVDSRGGRLGRGAGWYDEALMHAAPSAPRIAMCWSSEFVGDPLPQSPHDVPVDAVLTEHGVTFI